MAIKSPPVPAKAAGPKVYEPEVVGAKRKLSDLQTDKEFDLKCLFVGDSGSGKTHFTGTYTKGPIHYYMFDPGGEKTLEKPGMFNLDNITIDKFIDRDFRKPTAFDDFWGQMQTDEKDGFFDHMKSKQGLIVFDSGTTISQAIVDKVGKANGFPSKWEYKHWGQVTSILLEFIRVINSLPCACVLTTHLKEVKNAEGNLIEYKPLLTGQLAQTVGLYFSEYWLFKRNGDKTTVHFSGTGINPASSRVVSIAKADNITFDQIYDLYMSGKALIDKKGGN